MTVTLGEALPPVLRDGGVARHIKVEDGQAAWCDQSGECYGSMRQFTAIENGIYPVRRRAGEWVITIIDVEDAV